MPLQASPPGRVLQGFFGGNYDEECNHLFVARIQKVDYLIKIETDFEKYSHPKTLSQSTRNQGSNSAYVVESEHIKSKKNLIFH